MNYNPADKAEGSGPVKAKPGKYRFRVEEATEKTFNSGNEGCRLVLLVAAFSDRDVKVFDNLIYVPNSLWKTEQFLASLGFDFNHSPEVHRLVGKTGEAEFRINEKGYLEVDTYLPASANNAPGSRPAVQRQTASQACDFGPPPFDDNVPF